MEEATEVGETPRKSCRRGREEGSPCLTCWLPHWSTYPRWSWVQVHTSHTGNPTSPPGTTCHRHAVSGCPHNTRVLCPPPCDSSAVREAATWVGPSQSGRGAQPPHGNYISYNSPLSFQRSQQGTCPVTKSSTFRGAQSHGLPAGIPSSPPDLAVQMSLSFLISNVA